MVSFTFDDDDLSAAIAGLSAADPYVAVSAPVPGLSSSHGIGGVDASNNAIQAANVAAGLKVDIDDDDTGMFFESEFVPPPPDVFAIGKKRGGTTPSAKYRLFCLPTELSDLSNLCLGLIGQGATFCIKENCLTFHVGEKATVYMGDIHVMKTNETCFVEPVINRSSLAPELYDSWMNERVLLDEWTKRFALVRSSLDPVTPTAFNERDSFAKSAKKFKPSTPMTGLPDSKKLDLLLHDVFKTKVYEPNIGDREEFITRHENKPLRVLGALVDVVKLAEANLEEVSTGMVTTNNAIEKLNHQVQSEIPVLFSRQDNLEVVVGKRTAGILPNYECPTLWSSISLLSDIITETRKQVDDIHAEQLVLKTDSTTVASKVAKELVVQEVSTLDKRVTSLRESVATNMKTFITRINRDTGLIVELQGKIKTLEAMTNTISFDSNKRDTGTNVYESVGLELKSFREQLSTLETSVKALESQDLKDAIKFARLGFRNLGEAEAWVTKHQPGDYTYGLVVDVHMIFEHVYTKLNSSDSAQSTITRLDALRKLSVKNLSLGTAIDSFDKQVPKIFSKDESSPHSRNDESFFDQIPDYDAWDLTDYGHRDKILHQVHLFELSHKEAMNNYQNVNQDITFYNVASKSLTESVAWIKSFFLYIDNTYDELTRNKFSTKRGWSLVTRLATAILKDVGSPRNGVNNLWVVGENARICTLMFYAVVKCQDIMERYKSYNFKSDPAISGEYVRFLVMNTGLESLQNLEKKIHSLDDTVKNLNSTVQKLDKQQAATAGSVGDLKGQIAALQKLVEKNNKGTDHLVLSEISTSIRPQISTVTVEDNVCSTPPKRKFQAVEVHILPQINPIDVIYIFEGFPIWVIALEPMWIKTLVIVRFRSDLELFEHVEHQGHPSILLQRSLSRFGKHKVQFLCDITPEMISNLCLVSGKLPYLLRCFELFASSKQLIIGTVDCHFHQRFHFGRPAGVPRTSTPQVKWFRIRHATVGGCSTFVAVHGIMNSGHTIVPNVTSLGRYVGDFLDHSIRPKHLKDITMAPQPPLQVTDLISPLYWDRPVAYPTRFFGTGLGIRSLTVNELCSIFSFPVRVRTGPVPTQAFDSCIPLQLLHSILHPCLRLFAADQQPPPCKRVRRGSLTAATLDEILRVPIHHPSGTIDHTKSWIPAVQRWLPHSWISSDVVTPGAVKRDDAALPIHLWDQRLILLYPLCTPVHLETLRTFLLQKVVRRNVCRSFLCYLSETYGNTWASELKKERSLKQLGGYDNHRSSPLLTDVTAGLDVIYRFSVCSWWDWCDGSSLVFWRWGAYSSLARDGMAPYVCGPLPRFRRRSKQPTPDKQKLIASKFATILSRGYISAGPIISLTQFFDVPKGVSDIRLVYNGTSCGFNAALWCPKFWLPTAKSALRLLDYNFYSVDMDLGEMFLNFPLHRTLQPYSGVDLTPYKQLLNVTTPGPFHLRWTRTWMGARPSPYYAVRFYYLADEFIRGHHLDSLNPFYWDKIILNLPGSKSYDPSRPRVIKWNSITKSIAADLVVYVDDLRIQAKDVETAWRLAHVIASRLQYLGIQVAIRKHRPPTTSPGAWAGAIFKTTDSSVTVSISQDKWDKAKRLVQQLVQEMTDQNNQDQLLDYKNLEITRGFLVHLSMTFDLITPYLKGFHLALASHNKQRNSEGWKLNDNEWLNYLQNKVENGDLPQAELDAFAQEKKSKQKQKLHENNYNPPPKAKIVTQLKCDLYALQSFFDVSSPPHIEVRKKNIALLLYGFADASGGGLGSTVLIPGTGIRFRVGVWGSDADTTSSNFREFENVVLTVEEEARNGTLSGSSMFLFTDNSTVEGALFKGNTSSEKLFRLVVRLRKIELQFGATITVIHVSGKRMIAQGTDGISRGQLNEGVASGIPMLDFVPLHLTAIERSPVLTDWIKYWFGKDAEFLEPRDWFVRGHDCEKGSYDKKGHWRYALRHGKFVWAPAPAAADVALEELRKAVIKRQDSTHLFICPRLLTPEWRRQLSKVADCFFMIEAGCDIWPSDMYEPLTLGFIFPFYLSHLGKDVVHQKCATWQGFCQNCSKPRSWLQGIFCANFASRVGNYPPCRSLWCGMCYSLKDNDVSFYVREKEAFDASKDEMDEERLVKAWGNKHRSSSDYLHARDGDHLMVPFECDTCIFRKLRKQSPDFTSERDQLLLACIRRINLDAFWSRSTSTVKANKDRVRMFLSLSNTLGLSGPFSHIGSMPPTDVFGYEVALVTVLASRRSGKHSQSYTQFDTIRKYRTCYTNHYRSSPQGNRDTLALGDDKGKVQRFVGDSCSSFWYSRFSMGCKNRMGQDWRPNQAFSLPLLRYLLNEVKGKITRSLNQRDTERWTIFGTFVVITYVVSLRGTEGFLLDLGGLHRNKPTDETVGENSYFLIPLLGQVKGEKHDRCHLLPCTFQTSSGIRPYEWIKKLMDLKAKQNLFDGPAISDSSGAVLSSSYIDNLMHEVLEEVYDSNKELFPKSIKSVDDIRENYQAFRSFRRTSTTRAQEERVNVDDVNLVSRWHSIDKAGGKRPNFEMRFHYTQFEMLVKPFLRYTKAM